MSLSLIHFSAMYLNNSKIYCFGREVYFYFFFFFLLVIHFIHISVYMSIPISQFITPPPTHPRGFPTLVSICFCSTSVSQFLLCKLVHQYHFLGSTYMRQYMIFVFLFLTSFCMTVSRCIHVSTNDPILFLFMAE